MGARMVIRYLHPKHSTGTAKQKTTIQEVTMNDGGNTAF